MSETRPAARAKGMAVESEALRVRDRTDVTGIFALQLALADWIGAMTKRWKSRKNDRD